MFPSEDSPGDRPIREARRRRDSLSLLALVLLLSLITCQSGGARLHLKSSAVGETDMPVRSSYAFAVTKTLTDEAGKMTTAASYRVYAANYELDSNNFAITMDKPLASTNQLRIVLSLVGAEGSTEKTAPSAGTYSAKSDRYMKVEDVAIIFRKGNADTRLWLERGSLNGEVKVTSVTGDEVNGEIDLTSGEASVKGPFRAKILTRK